MSEGSGGWYVRARGRTLGPFTLPQLESMRDRGQLSQFHEVSQDRRFWVSASHVPELFPKAASGQEAFAPSSGADEGGYLVVEGTSPSPGLPVSEAAPSWFVARG